MTKTAIENLGTAYEKLNHAQLEVEMAIEHALVADGLDLPVDVVARIASCAADVRKLNATIQRKHAGRAALAEATTAGEKGEKGDGQ